MQDLVVSDIALVLKEFLDTYAARIPNLKFIYDENLSYDTAIANYRAKNNMTGEINEALPLFVFNRSVLRWSEHGAMRRSVTFRPKGLMNMEDGTALKYKAVHGEFDLNFSLVFNSMSEVENFEVSYLAELNTGGDKEITVTLSPEFGEFKYFVQLQPLDDKLVNIENAYYKTVMGRVLIRGFFFTIFGQGRIIKEINLVVQDTKQNLLY